MGRKKRRYSAPEGLIKKKGSPYYYTLIHGKAESTKTIDLNLAQSILHKRKAEYFKKVVTSEGSLHAKNATPNSDGDFVIKTKEGEVIFASKGATNLEKTINALMEMRKAQEIAQLEEGGSKKKGSENTESRYRLINREGSPSWWIEAKIGGSTICRDTQTDDRDLAERILERLKKLLGKRPPSPESIKKGIAASERARVMYDDILKEQINRRTWDGFYIYFAQAGENGPVKIGLATNVETRLRDINVSNPEKITLLAVIKGNKRLESKLHKKFAHLKIKGEWFRSEKELLEFCKECSRENKDRNENIPFSKM